MIIVRKSFLEDLCKNIKYLKEAGFTEKDILKMQNCMWEDSLKKIIDEKNVW